MPSNKLNTFISSLLHNRSHGCAAVPMYKLYHFWCILHDKPIIRIQPLGIYQLLLLPCRFLSVLNDVHRLSCSFSAARLLPSPLVSFALPVQHHPESGDKREQSCSGIQKSVVRRMYLSIFSLPSRLSLDGLCYSGTARFNATFQHSIH